MKNYARIIISILFMITFCSIGFSVENGTITGDGVRLREKPDGKIITKLSKNTIVAILEKSKEEQTINGYTAPWYKIRTDKNEEGWIFGQFLLISNAKEESYPEKFIRNIYTKVHLPWEDLKTPNQINFSDKKELSKYFDDKLVDLFIRDEQYASLHPGELVSCIDADPIYDAQDGEPVTKDIVIKKILNKENVFSVTFNNLGTRTLIYKLVNTAQGWRITDIEYSWGTLLKALSCSHE
jgi:hypothetical protein